MKKLKTFETFINNINPISQLIKTLRDSYKEEYGVDACDINSGECENFAELIQTRLKEEYNIEAEILSDGLFFDPFGDCDEEDLWDVTEFGSELPNNIKEKGMLSHYWIYYDKKHYDSDTPEGVTNMFDLNIFKNIY